MAIFQNSVVREYAKKLNPQDLDLRFKNFQRHFLDVKRQAEIRKMKEEEYKPRFLPELFAECLGYTIRPDEGFNFTVEHKNVDDSKKADAAIIREGKTLGVVEVKGTDTTDLTRAAVQAFGYKNHQPDARYVVVTNFEQLRFFVDNAVEYEEFDLFNLDRAGFERLFLCLAWESIRDGLPPRIKAASVSEEDQITKRLYADYSAFRAALFADIREKNPQHEALALFRKTQKLIDRFLFILFAEDRGLLPANLTASILTEWKSLKKARITTALYDRFKLYFNDLLEGNREQDIFAYNGGLFRPDEVLDSLSISDEVLLAHALKLSNYDFASEVDVDILGHIFEHSLSEIEEVEASLSGAPAPEKVSKRKKEGIFYTPKYITQYIVENTLGKLCAEKKKELGLDVPEAAEEGNAKKARAQRDTRLAACDTFREWLLGLTICDPACGSGAFLNAALDFLMAEHRALDVEKARIQGDALIFSDIENSILEHNLYGVDLNEESVEIAKLSLWLRTAHKGRKLSTLTGNIKCGNSLISDPAIAGDKAFDWPKEFPKVFGKGGFDVVIGNPPYVNAIELKKTQTTKGLKYLKNSYVTAKGTVDLYVYFFERGLNLINSGGYLAYITPNRYLSASYGKALREHLLINFSLDSLIDYSDKDVFPDASTYPVITFIKRKNEENSPVTCGKVDAVTKTMAYRSFPRSKLSVMEDSILGFLLNDKLTITEKIIAQGESLQKVGKINATSTAAEADEYSKLINEQTGYKLINTGTIDPYLAMWGFSELTDKGMKYLRPFLPKDANAISLNRHRLYSSPKIIVAKIGLKCEAFYDRIGEYASINTNCVHSFDKNYLPEYILCWLNSRLYNYVFECLFDGLRMAGGYLLFSAPNLLNTYVKCVSLDQQRLFVGAADKMMSLNTDLQIERSNYLSRVRDNLPGVKITGALESFEELDFAGFLKELKKQKIKLALSAQAEWETFFNESKAAVTALSDEIAKTDREIDQKVYELYGLTDAEIAIVENASH
ncbi:MAG: Eco57I restriction-modification methylase domain-containing protein [Kiritimatiellia bacterium]